MSYITELFGNMTAEDSAANDATMAHRDALMAKPAYTAHAGGVTCPKCMGSGRIAAYSHIKAGECFTCGGSGIFARYAA